MTESIPNLYAPVCPNCKGGNIVFERRDIALRTVAGFNEQGEIEYLPDAEGGGDDDSFACQDCYSEFNSAELYDATFAPEEGGDGSAPPF